MQRLLADRVSILWTTNQPGAGSVVVSDANGGSIQAAAQMTAFPSQVTQMTSDFYQYQADITGLKAGGSYSYQVLMNGVAVAVNPAQYKFRTPTPGDFSFLVFGDSGANSPQQIALVQQMAAETGVSKAIHVGDLAYEAGTFAQFESNYFALNASLMSALPFFTTPGNHEYVTNSAAPYLAGHAAPASAVPVPSADLGRYYSFDWADAHFTSLDSNLLSGAAASRMLVWLDADLAASQKYWKIVFLHHPPYPTGTHLDDPLCALVQQNVNPIVERHGVQLLLSGHEHGYERSYPLAGGQKAAQLSPSTTYVISGGGGGVPEDVGSLPQCALSVAAFNYLRIDVSGGALTLNAIGLGGTSLDRITLNPPPAIAPKGVVNAGDFSPAIASGSLVSIFGQNFAVRPAWFSSFPLPHSLSGISVTANGAAAPVLYVSPGQINVQMPFEVSGTVTLELTTPNGSSSATVTVSPAAPAILAVISGNNLNSGANPAAAGEYVMVYATGLGACAESIATGAPAPARPAPVNIPVQLILGGAVVQPSYAGLAPGFAGVNQVNFKVPQGVASGALALAITAGGVTSNSVPLTVGASVPVSGTAQRATQQAVPGHLAGAQQSSVAYSAMLR